LEVNRVADLTIRRGWKNGNRIRKRAARAGATSLERTPNSIHEGTEGQAEAGLLRNGD